MSKELKMIQLKKDEIEIRRNLVSKACKECIDEGVDITHKEISRRTQIPHKSLERAPYKEDINYYKNINKKEELESKEIQVLRGHIKYLNDIIKQINRENHNLKTELYNNGKI